MDTLFDSALKAWFIFLVGIVIIVFSVLGYILSRPKKRRKPVGSILPPPVRAPAPLIGELEFNKLLRGANLHYLEFILNTLLIPAQDEIYNRFWKKFEQFFPQSLSKKRAGQLIVDLRAIVRARLRKK